MLKALLKYLLLGAGCRGWDYRGTLIKLADAVMKSLIFTVWYFTTVEKWS